MCVAYELIQGEDLQNLLSEVAALTQNEASLQSLLTVISYEATDYASKYIKNDKKAEWEGAMTTVLRCDLELHDSLYFATREIERLYEMERVIHNYALCYALGLASSPYFTRRQTPAYLQDLSSLNGRGIYVTPARAMAADFMLNT